MSHDDYLFHEGRLSDALQPTRAPWSLSQRARLPSPAAASPAIAATQPSHDTANPHRE